MDGRKGFIDWKFFFFVLIALSLAVAPAGFAREHHGRHHHEHESAHHERHRAHWGYEGKHGPEHWGEMKKEFRACGEGRTQSPINISNVRGTSNEKVELHYGPTKINIENNGHSIEVVYDRGSYLKVNGKRYDLAQFHFHSPSEHTVNGRHSAMEMHLVHKSKDGGFAVVGVLIEKGEKENRAYSDMWGNLPKKAGQEKHVGKKVNVGDLLPAGKAFYNYSGSFTTPPCTEGVKWFVMKEKVYLSGDQIKAFGKIMHGDNRPTQPLNGRTITSGSL